MTFVRLSRWLALPVLLFFALPAFATDYYVDSTAGAAGDGSMGDPFDALSDCDSAMSAGDRCIMVSGSTFGTFTPTTEGISHTSRITYIGEDSTVTVNNLALNNRDYMTFENFTLTGSPTCTFAAICSHLQFIDIETGTNGGFRDINGTDVLLDGIHYNHTGGSDFTLWRGERWVIRNSLWDTANCGASHCDFMQYYCVTGGDWPASDYLLMENNVMVDVIGGNAHFHLIHLAGTAGTCAGADGPVTNQISRYNKTRNVNSTGCPICTDNTGGAPGFTGIAAYNNTVVDSGGGSHPTWNDYNVIFTNVTAGTYFAPNNLFSNSMDYAGAEVALPTNAPVPCSLVYDPDGTVTVSGALQTYQSSAVLNQNPQLTDPANDDFTLAETSPAVDKGCALTTTANSGSTSTSLTLTKAWLFQDGWADVDPDCIAIETVGNTACIVAGSINYSTGAATLDAPLTWSSGANVWLYSDSDGTVVLAGSAPDIGADEFGASGDMTAPTLTGSTPADNATGVNIDSAIVLTFSENVFAGSGDFTLKRTSDDMTIETIAVGSTTINGVQVTIPLSTMMYSTEFYLLADAATVLDGATNQWAGISVSTDLSFTTESQTATGTFGPALVVFQ